MRDIIGVDCGKVRVISYCPEWETLFAEECAEIMKALGSVVAGIEHIGSTSIPNMSSKPIIDLMVVLDDFESVTTTIARLEEIDYRHEPDDPVPEREFLVKPPLHVPYRTHHLSLTRAGSVYWRNNLAFREYMVRHPGEAAAYGRLKLELAALHADDRAAYTSAKQPYIQKVLPMALAEFGQKSEPQ